MPARYEPVFDMAKLIMSNSTSGTVPHTFCQLLPFNLYSAGFPYRSASVIAPRYNVLSTIYSS
ncbi:MAG: hypothetical protein KFF49_05810, partial [Bacteroidales bacterium]|nr:hypothetical protein [Bacteroidales bacterium]